MRPLHAQLLALSGFEIDEQNYQTAVKIPDRERTLLVKAANRPHG